MSDKAAVSAQISELIGTPPRPLANGGTVMRPFLEDVAGFVGVPSTGLTKVDLTRALVIKLGQTWDAACDSTNTESGGGGNVTRVALERILEGLKNQFFDEEVPVTDEDAALPGGLDLLWRQGYEAIAAELDAEGHLDVTSLEDERWRMFSAVAQRRGQAVFRRRLIRAYGGVCAITGCDAVAALEAAHIVPFMGQQTDVVTNGLLLRADVHTLFDLGLLGVRVGDRRVVLDAQLRGTTYEQLHGVRIADPSRAAEAPDEAVLQWRAENIGPAAALGS